MTARAIIFDFDGTLADTMMDNHEAWRRTFEEYGANLRPEQYFPLEGMSSPELPIMLGEILGVRVSDPLAAARAKDRHYLELHRFCFFPGVEELVARLRSARVPLAVVSAGTRSRIEASAPRGFLDNFVALVTSDDTEHGKPSPAPYLKGAEKLGVPPPDCVVVENAPLGIRSAKAAGAYCIALCQTLPADDLREADEILPAFRDLPSSPVIRAALGSEARGA